MAAAFRQGLKVKFKEFLNWEGLQPIRRLLHKAARVCACTCSCTVDVDQLLCIVQVFMQ